MQLYDEAGLEGNYSLNNCCIPDASNILPCLFLQLLGVGTISILPVDPDEVYMKSMLAS